MLLVAVLFLFLLRKSKNGGAILRNMLFMDMSEIRFLLYMRTVRSQIGTKVTRVGDRDEVRQV